MGDLLMKPQLKNLTANCALNLLALITLVAFGCGCNLIKPRPDPLTGWHFETQNPDERIDRDYHLYIQELSLDERNGLGPALYYKDGSGQHAIAIMIGINNRTWRHILIYDKDDHRIKTIKYVSGGYQS